MTPEKAVKVLVGMTQDWSGLPVVKEAIRTLLDERNDLKVALGGQKQVVAALSAEVERLKAEVRHARVRKWGAMSPDWTIGA